MAMTLEEALVIAAEYVLACQAERAEWENWPEIGEHDWKEIGRRVDKLAPFPPRDQTREALALLEARADG